MIEGQPPELGGNSRIAVDYNRGLVVSEVLLCSCAEAPTCVKSRIRKFRAPVACRECRDQWPRGKISRIVRCDDADDAETAETRLRAGKEPLTWAALVAHPGSA